MKIPIDHHRSYLPTAKLWCIILMLLAFTPSVTTAAGQQERITINVKNVTVKGFLAELQRTTKLDVVYASRDIDEKQRITYRCQNKVITEVLKETVGKVGLSYKIEKGMVVIFKEIKGESVSGAIAPAKSVQSLRNIRGRVLDQTNNQPMIGVTVQVPNTSIGVATNADGRFELTVPNDRPELLVAFIGYQKQLIDITEKSNLFITMTPDITQVEDVVVTGVFTRKQNTYSGSVTTIKSDDLKKTGSLNILQAIGNLDPSFNILVNDEMGSNPNAMPDIQMRGAASFSDMKNTYTSSPNQPLFIVDGFEQPIQKVMDMDMNRVESVTLLKDATAKAIYGSKAANGVVVIETMQPEQGRLRVSYSGDLNIQTPVLGDYRRTNASEKLEVERRAGMYKAKYPAEQLRLDQKYNAIQQEILRGVNTDWLAQPTRVGVGHKHSLNIEGGDDAVRYNVNVAYNDISGVMKGSSRKTFEGGFNLQYRYKNILFKEQLSIMSNISNESPFGSFSDYAKMNPYWRPYDQRGNLNEILGTYNRSEYTDLDGDGIIDDDYLIYNPMANAQTNYLNQKQYLDVTNNLYVDWTISESFRVVGRLSISTKNTNTDLFHPSNYGTLDPRSPLNFRAVRPDAANEGYFKRGLYEKSKEDLFSVSSDITLNYSKQIKKHLIFANAQYNVSTVNSVMNGYQGQGFADNATNISQARQYVEFGRPTGVDGRTNELGVIGSVNYSYDSRYMFDANYRASASSLFGANNRWGHFWSVGAGWNVHNEKFMGNANWIDNLKLRASFGYTGSQNFSPYQAISTYSYFSDKIYDNVTGAYLLGLNNPDLKWQQTQDQNVGVDFSFLKRFDVSFDYYIKNTSNLLTPVTSPPSNGFDKYTENLGMSRNEGVEATINYRIITDAKRDINLSTFFNLGHNKNTLVEINNSLQSFNDKIDKEQGDGGKNQEIDKGKTRPRVEYAEGASMSAIWGVRSMGINPYNGEEIFIDRFGKRVNVWSVDDKVILGDALPKFQGNFGASFDIKGFSVNVNFAYNLGGQYYNQTLVDNLENADLQYNVDRRVMSERWNPETPGVAAKYRELKQGETFTNPTSRFVQDFNELRLTSLNVGYDFRNCNFMKKSNAVERLRVSMAMNELFRLSTVKAERGIAYPYAQSFIFSVQLAF